MSYKNLEIWQIANELVIKVHKMTLELLPSFEMYEEGSQIRRSSKSSKSLKDEKTYRDILQLAEKLGRKLNRFISSVQEKHNVAGEPVPDYF